MTPAKDGAPDGRALVRGKAGTFETSSESRGHVLVIDEPTDLGGTDVGPTPHEVLLAALGACTSLTLRMYATRKNLSVRSVDVELSQRRVVETASPAGATTAGAPPSGKPRTRIERGIVVEGDVTDAELARLAQIADLCPVHRTLEGGPEIVTTIRRAP